MRIKSLASMAAAAMLLASPALAEPPAPDFKRLMTPTVMKDIRSWLDTEIVRMAIGAQNQRLNKLEQAKIDTLDKQWRAEREADDKPLIAATLSNPLSVYLARMQGRSLGLYAEIFVMDQNGLNVGQSSITSDFWQGDEAKFQKTYDVAKDAVFIDDPEWDDETKIWRGQVSMTLTDATGNNKLGAATIEINLTELERRASLGL